MCWSTQVSGTLERIFIEKKRNGRGTFCEYFSHFILILLLVFGYNLSTIFDFPEANYAQVKLTIPINNLTTTDLMDLFHGPLIVPDLDTYINFGNPPFPCAPPPYPVLPVLPVPLLLLPVLPFSVSCALLSSPCLSLTHAPCCR